MSITSDLEQILSARYGKDVRQAIHDSIEEGYNIAVQAQGIAETSQESAKAYAQAALASEQAAEDYKTAAEQAAQQAMSGTPEGYADLVAKVNSIYRQTATSYNVVGTSEGSALAHTIYGMSVQDGTPTPSVPVEIKSAKADFKCVGKNLIPYPYGNYQNVINGVTFTINPDGTITANGTATANAQFYFHFRHNAPENNPLVLVDGRYHLSGCPSGGTENTYELTITKTINNEFSLIGNDRGNGLDFVLSGGDYFNRKNTTIGCLVQIHTGYTANNLVFKPMITFANVSDSDYAHYEPYKATEVTTDLTLRALEVTSSDDYNLEKDGKYYIADTVDWSEDRGYEITRRVGVYQADGTRTVYSSPSNNPPDGYCYSFYGTQNAYSEDVASDKWYHGLSDMFSNIMSPSALKSSVGVYSVIQTPTQFVPHFYITLGSSYSTTTLAQEWLATNKPTFYYILTSITTESITSEQAQALLSLKTYDEATSISATGDIEPSLDLEYSKDRNTALALTGHNLGFKNALKLNDINTALIELGGN